MYSLQIVKEIAKKDQTTHIFIGEQIHIVVVTFDTCAQIQCFHFHHFRVFLFISFGNSLSETSTNYQSTIL